MPRRSTHTSPAGRKAYRNSLLAVVHIGKKELALDDETYQDLLDREFEVISAADLSNKQLVKLIEILRALGFKRTDTDQAEALRERARDLAGKLENGEARLQNLCFSLCGVQRLDWCHEISKLKRLLAALGKINRSENV